MDDERAGAAFLPAQVRETHSGLVFLVGDRAYKIKKPVDLGFLDFRTEAAREQACRREVELNRRLSPDVYLDLASVVGSDGRVLEHVVVMQRMADELRLSAKVARGDDVDDDLRSLARIMAAFHAAAERGDRISAEGGAQGLLRRWTDNLRESDGFRGGLLDASLFDEIERLALGYVAGRTPLLDERVAAGLIVDGHGDLIAEDVFCLPDHPRVLDCLEFSDRLRWVDVLDDVAFLAMDLERLGRPDLGERFLSWYAEFGATPAPMSLRHHYVAYRAFVRAKVACIRAAQGSTAAVDDARQLAAIALAHLRAAEVVLVLVGGAPGTGKTTLATALADRVDAVLLSTDVVREEMPLAPVSERYSAARKEAVYCELLHRAGVALEQGRSVVADATWGSAGLRRVAEDLAVATTTRLVAIECRAPTDVAARRAQRRRDSGTDPSEADAEIVRLLAAERDPWPEATVFDTGSTQGELGVALGVVRGS